MRLAYRYPYISMMADGNRLRTWQSLWRSGIQKGHGGRTASDLALHMINETAGRFKPRTNDTGKHISRIIYRTIAVKSSTLLVCLRQYAVLYIG
jgi:hypothetical protein